MHRQQSKHRLVEKLRQQIAQMEASRGRTRPAVLQGGSPLDQILPQGGFRLGTLTEWLAEGAGSGVGTLAFLTAQAACREGQALVVLDEHHQFYPPAAARLGIPLQNLIVVRAAAIADDAWALDQTLRCPGVGAAVAWPEKLDDRTFRRLQLAVEESGALGLLIRPLHAQHEPSWAEVRLLVEPLPSLSPQSYRRRTRIHLLHGRSATSQRSIDVEIDDETRTVHLATPLAQSTACRRAM